MEENKEETGAGSGGFLAPDDFAVEAVVDDFVGVLTESSFVVSQVVDAKVVPIAPQPR